MTDMEFPLVPALDPVTRRIPDKYLPAGLEESVTQVEQAKTDAQTAAASAASNAQEAVNAVPAAVTSALSTWFLRGNGSPVGVVKPASAGVQYVDLASTNGARIWISTGTTASAWQVVDGDTGWRNLAALCPQFDFTTNEADRLWVRRTSTTINLILIGVNLSQGSLLLPAGFRCSTPGLRVLAVTAADGAGQVYRLLLNDILWLYGLTVGSRYSLSARWMTENAWPTTLPGTPA